jgi:hypothetical protein
VLMLVELHGGRILADLLLVQFCFHSLESADGDEY